MTTLFLDSALTNWFKATVKICNQDYVGILKQMSPYKSIQFFMVVYLSF